MSTFHSWFAARGWTPFPFQEACWAAWQAGESGILHAPTGAGKTLALWGGPLLEACAAPSRNPHLSNKVEPGLQVLWLTPLRALARETVGQLEAPLGPLGLAWRVELRTGDTPSSVRARQRSKPPAALVTTPESLSVLLSFPEAQAQFGALQGVIVDEWHELMGSKRGVQVELALARLRTWNPALRVWGISATLSNLAEAAEMLGGCAAPADPSNPIRRPRIIEAGTLTPIEVETLAPPRDRMGRFPWSGHLGLHLLPQVLGSIEETKSALLFTNTRAQAELWFEALAAARPEWAASGALALHHGSLDRTSRETVEAGLREGNVRLAVCTSSLDLGVDFPAVDRVFQVGSPKGIARLRQRAGRSDHRPGGRPRIFGVPTHAFELLEFAAARRALSQGSVEPRPPMEAPLDVLAQHLVTLACGEGFRPTDLLSEVRTTRAYRDLSDEAWGWVLDFVTRGGSALQAYPRYRKVVEVEGLCRVAAPSVARQHRMGIGTITDEAQVQVRFVRGGAIGTVESSFLARLRPGDVFLLGGRTLQLVRLRDGEAQVRRTSAPKGAVPRWMGGRLPLSTTLGHAVLETLAAWRRGAPLEGTEADALSAILELQGRWSRIPDPDTLLVELSSSREGHHLFCFPFLGRTVHEGMAAILAHRMARIAPRTVQMTANDYGFELVSPTAFPSLNKEAWNALVTPDGLSDDLQGALNATELARRHFREIARIAGLVDTGRPGRKKAAHQVQASSGLLFDVLTRWDPENLLVVQARREVLERELAFTQLRDGFTRISGLPVHPITTERLTPLAFPLWAERTHAQLSTEGWLERVQRMAESLEVAAQRSGRPMTHAITP